MAQMQLRRLMVECESIIELDRHNQAILDAYVLVHGVVEAVVLTDARALHSRPFEHDIRQATVA